MSTDGHSRAQRLAHQQAEKDLLEVLSSPAGRRMIMRFVDQSGVFTHMYSSVPTDVAYREGRRSVGIDLIGMMEAAQPGVFANLQLEALALQQRRQQDQPEAAHDEDL